MKDFSDIRSVDVYSATSGKMVHELLRYNSLITSLSGFNSDGTTLATSSGSIYWSKSTELTNSIKLSCHLYQFYAEFAFWINCSQLLSEVFNTFREV